MKCDKKQHSFLGEIAICSTMMRNDELHRLGEEESIINNMMRLCRLCDYKGKTKIQIPGSGLRVHNKYLQEIFRERGKHLLADEDAVKEGRILQDYNKLLNEKYIKRRKLGGIHDRLLPFLQHRQDMKKAEDESEEQGIEVCGTCYEGERFAEQMSKFKRSRGCATEPVSRKIWYRCSVPGCMKDPRGETVIVCQSCMNKCGKYKNCQSQGHGDWVPLKERGYCDCCQSNHFSTDFPCQNR